MRGLLIEEDDVAALFGCAPTSRSADAHDHHPAPPRQPAVPPPPVLIDTAPPAPRITPGTVQQHVVSVAAVRPAPTVALRQEALHMALSLFSGKASRPLPSEGPPSKRVYRPAVPSPPSPPPETRHPDVTGVTGQQQASSSPLCMDALRAAMDGAAEGPARAQRIKELLAQVTVEQPEELLPDAPRPRQGARRSLQWSLQRACDEEQDVLDRLHTPRRPPADDELQFMAFLMAG